MHCTCVDVANAQVHSVFDCCLHLACLQCIGLGQFLPAGSADDWHSQAQRRRKQVKSVNCNAGVHCGVPRPSNCLHQWWQRLSKCLHQDYTLSRLRWSVTFICISRFAEQEGCNTLLMMVDRVK